MTRKYVGDFTFNESGAVRHQHNNELNRKNGFARRAKLVQKLRWRKATKSNLYDKVSVGYEALKIIKIPGLSC